MLRNLFDKGGQRPTGSGSAQCAHVQSCLPSYLDHELNGSERRLIEGHLEQCSACRADLAAYERAESALGCAVSTIPSPGDMRAEFYARLERSRRTPAAFRWGYALPAVACAGLVLLALSIRPAEHVQVPPAAVHGSNPVVTRESVAHSHDQARTESGTGNWSLTGNPVNMARLSPTNEKQRARNGVAVAGGRFAQASRLRSRLPRGIIVASRPAIDPVRRIVVPHTGSVVSVASLRAKSLPSSVVSEAEGMSKLAGRDSLDVKSTLAEERGTPRGGRISLASLATETELHVSDENRDFMASTHIQQDAPRGDSRPSVQLDNDNERAQETVELPALP